jgi:acetyltransferase-like isoleucine patch superfamily enzyme
MFFNYHNLQISPKASLGKDVRIGDNTIIFDNVIIEDNVTISHNCVIGEPLNGYYTDPEYTNPQTIIGANSLIRSHAIIYAGNTLGKNVSTGHRINLRENNVIGDNTVIGTLSDIQGYVTIGNNCRLYTNVVLSQGWKIGNYVFLYPFVVLTNDPDPPSYDLKGGSIADYSIIAVHSTILAGVSVGENCFVGANSVVNKNIPDYSLSIGSPAKVVMDIRKYVRLGKGNLYPWMYRYSKGMPWHLNGFENWIENPDSKI